jgi:hypothetical protein
MLTISITLNHDVVSILNRKTKAASKRSANT